MNSAKYTPTIGIETHVQLKTKTKLFAAVGNDARGAPTNTLISHICVGLPGALPVLNQAAIELATRAALALNTKPQPASYFERKHYFYPDLPKGYQISQYAEPLIKGGHVDITVDGKSRRIKIERAHLEEDAGKNIHPAGANYSLVDLNRAGTPLLEIVSAPDLHSPAEAKAYVRELWLLMKYAGATDGDLYHGHVRFDVNISMAKAGGPLGKRSEIKNLNSFRTVEAAIAYEIDRQIELLDKGQPVVQETRGWDEAKQKSLAQRSKEEAEDYRYMPEPDVPPLELDEVFIKKIESKMTPLPTTIRRALAKLDIEASVIEDILDRPEAARYTLEVLEQADSAAARRAVFWFLQVEPAATDDPDFVLPPLEVAKVIELSNMVATAELSSTAARAVFAKLLKSDDNPRAIAKQMNLLQMSDEAAIAKIVEAVLAANPQVVVDVKAGQVKAIGWLIGQVMANSQGQANPQTAQKLIKQYLNL